MGTVPLPSPHLQLSAKIETSSSDIAEKPRCRVGQFWPKVQDDILQTIWVYLTTVT